MHPHSKPQHYDYMVTKFHDRRDIKFTCSFHNTCYLSDHIFFQTKSRFCVNDRWVKNSTRPKHINILPLKSQDKLIELFNKLDMSLTVLLSLMILSLSGRHCMMRLRIFLLKSLGCHFISTRTDLMTTARTPKCSTKKYRICTKLGCKIRNMSKKCTYKFSKLKVKRLLRRIKETWWSAEASELQDAVDHKNSKSFYAGLKTIHGRCQCGSNPVLSADGEALLTDKADILKCWKSHF